MFGKKLGGANRFLERGKKPIESKKKLVREHPD